MNQGSARGSREGGILKYLLSFQIFTTILVEGENLTLPLWRKCKPVNLFKTYNLYCLTFSSLPIPDMNC